MNAAQAKKISMYDLLGSLGFTPADTRKNGNEIWYQSPFRNEKDASFKIRIDQNVWYDFGEGEGGNILDFVMKYNRCGFNEALNFLENRNLQPSLIRPVASNTQQEPALDLFSAKSPLINSIKPVYHYALKEYLKGRGIMPAVGFRHLKEIDYTVEGKNYFALGFKNDGEGWELRSSIFKGCIGKKDISLIETDSDRVHAFEGFMDFLSCLTLREGQELDGDVLVLNSISMKGRAVALVKEKNYSHVETYFDNDKGGLAAHELFRKELPLVNITARNSLYMPYNDLNDYLKSKMIKQLA